MANTILELDIADGILIMRIFLFSILLKPQSDCFYYFYLRYPTKNFSTFEFFLNIAIDGDNELQDLFM